MNFSTLSLQQDGELLRVTISNPPINLMSHTMIEELFQLVGHLHMNPGIKVVLFESADEDFFIAHFDLEGLAESVSNPEHASKYPDINSLQALALSWQAVPQITIAKINGRCRGGGLEFTQGLSMRFATTESLFCFPEASGGFLAAGGGTTFTALAAGPARALEFLLSARDFNGSEAERYGLINRALPANELDAYVDDLIGRLLKRSPAVIAMHREALRQIFQNAVEPIFAGLASENDGMRAGLAGSEVQDGITMLLAAGQTRENELDLPGTLARLQPPAK
ncbi:TPA: enoyl-CoA hydratase/isomerase family protein [Pseudomonas aeruginosa]|uniref:enoyl-CoA hydratase/isomerase family protein n=1 Tax=Pseudomonas aeruginosa TaxID=287 RepID=UPI000464B6F5|nr:enoyl-CoA hydratase/isomerase family protein [Pseudomonas aeruginosa]KYO75103.1 Carnitinyl-CoA dehydratase [Pseudomonas aeruginosa]HCE6396356.1 enoyl-CoA hydratase/isomerase family protein [Pseudomonas aeruginosa]